MNMDIIDAAGQILRQGGLVAFPTETVYGLGANALDEEAARKTYAAKGRPSDNPLIVHIADLKDLYPITKGVPEKAVALAEKFWPGPLSSRRREATCQAQAPTPPEGQAPPRRSMFWTTWMERLT